MSKVSSRVSSIVQTCVAFSLQSSRANIDSDDLYSFDERRIYDDQDIMDLVSVACDVLGKHCRGRPFDHMCIFFFCTIVLK